MALSMLWSLLDVLIRRVYFGTAISSYPLPAAALGRMRSGFMRITTYLGLEFKR